MQIQQIILYSNDGEVRRLKFKMGAVNIITGDSATGKSALIEIVDYCLGRSKCSVPSGIIRDTVSWFGIILQFKKSQMYIARENPLPGKQNSNVYFEEAVTIEPSNTPPEKYNSNTESLIEILSNKIGISPNLYVPPRGQTREKFSATIRHGLLLCFQKQDEIANSRILFHRQSDGFIAQAIKDTLEYFLGAIREDRLALLQNLHYEKRKLFRAKRELEEAEIIRGEGVNKAVELVAQAKDVGILNEKDRPTSTEEYVSTMKKVASWEPHDIKIPRYYLLEEYQKSISDLKKELRDKNSDITSAEMFANEVEGFTNESTHQEKRLESIKLYDRDSEHQEHCPLCSNSIKNVDNEITSIEKMLEEIQSDLFTSEKTTSNIRNYIKELEEQKEEISKDIDEKTKQVSSLLNEQHSMINIRDENIRQSEIVGKVKFWLDSVSDTDETSKLRLAVEEAEKKVAELESLISDEEKTMRLSSILQKIGIQMTIWAKDLKLEHSLYPSYFDLKNLTVSVQRGDETIRLAEMGSAENWLGYHLILLFTLHLYFLRNNRPVPNFIFLDQPSQVYYPPDLAKSSGGSIEKLRDEDRKAVQRLFKLIFDATKLMNPDLQIIVTDHAKLETKDFKNSIIEEWRGGQKLIPETWI